MTSSALSNKVAIVTGGSQGIGLATVRALSSRGMLVVAMARNQDRLDHAIGSLSSVLRDNVVGIAGDVSRDSSVASVVMETKDRFGHIDVLVNSAGVSMTAKRSLADTTTDEWRRLIDTNLTGTYFMCREVLPHLSDNGGYILNVLSTAAFSATAGVSLYAASKFGARALTEALIDEYAGSRVRVTSVSPGPVDTTIWDHKLEPPSADKRAAMLRPTDIADIFVWLLDQPPRFHIRDITVTPWA